MRRGRGVKPRFWGIMIALTVMIFGGGKLVLNQKLAEDVRYLEALKERYVELTDMVSDLEEDIAYAQTDAFVERMAREQLGLIMPGEIRYVCSR